MCVCVCVCVCVLLLEVNEPSIIVLEIAEMLRLWWCHRCRSGRGEGFWF